MPAVDVMVPKLHLLLGNTPFQQVQNTGEAVLAAGEQNDNLVVLLQGQETVQIDGLHMGRIFPPGERWGLSNTSAIDGSGGRLRRLEKS